MACIQTPWSRLEESEGIKENRGGRGQLSGASLGLLWLGPLMALLLAAWLEQTLPPALPSDAPAGMFSATRAHNLLVNLTELGPRVTGSYENEVSAVALLVASLRALAPPPGSALRLDVDVQRADGAFTLDFLDGMSNVYRGVQSVVARISPAAAGGGGARRALLLNCHFDSVPDSAGAADDAAGCAVLLETARALLAAPSPAPRHDLLLLFNGAEENIMQASHAFVTQHRWAGRVAAFINLEACGAGGRELLFQSTAGAGGLLRQYAAHAPRPFASSLAQEVFQSGLVPADTDFRIFRDFGHMVGVDLAWSADGYAYHTSLDAAGRMPPPALQHAGDNVLALVRGLLASESLPDASDAATDEALVYFDVLGLWMLLLGVQRALLVAAAVLLLLAARLRMHAAMAARQLLVSRGAWCRVVLRAAARTLLASIAGLLAAVLLALALHHAGLRLCWYAYPWLLVPLYGAPAVAGALLVLSASGAGAGAGATSWWRARAMTDALALLWGAAFVAALLLRLRSAYVPGIWVAALSVVALLPRCLPPRTHAAKERLEVWCWAAASLAPTLQALYVSLSALALFVPLAGRAGTRAPPDVLLAAMTAAPALAATAPLAALLPLHSRGVVRALAGALLLSCAAAAVGGALLPRYTPLRPQRYMLFHARRTHHPPPQGEGQQEQQQFEELQYWLPALDVNTPESVLDHVPALVGAQSMSGPCQHVYCGAPYFLPARSLLPHAYWLPAAAPPAVTLHANVTLRDGGDTRRVIDMHLTGPAHMVIIVSPGPGVELTNCSLVSAPRAGPPCNGRPTYMLTLAHAAAGRAPARWHVTFTLTHAPAARRPHAGWARLSVAGHAMFGPAQRAPEHQRLVDSFPPWTQVTGWGVDMHLYTL